MKVDLLRRLDRWDFYQKWTRFALYFGKLFYTAARKTGLGKEESINMTDRLIRCIAQTGCHTVDQVPLSQFLFELLRNEIGYALKMQNRKNTLQDTHGAADPIHEEALWATDFRLRMIWKRLWKHHLKSVACEHMRTQSDPSDYQLFHLYFVKSWSIRRLSHVFRRSWTDVFRAIWRQRKVWLIEIHRLEKNILDQHLLPPSHWSEMFKPSRNHSITH